MGERHADRNDGTERDQAGRHEERLDGHGAAIAEQSRKNAARKQRIQRDERLVGRVTGVDRTVSRGRPSSERLGGGVRRARPICRVRAVAKRTRRFRRAEPDQRGWRARYCSFPLHHFGRAIDVVCGAHRPNTSSRETSQGFVHHDSIFQDRTRPASRNIAAVASRRSARDDQSVTMRQTPPLKFDEYRMW